MFMEQTLSYAIQGKKTEKKKNSAAQEMLRLLMCEVASAAILPGDWEVAM